MKKVMEGKRSKTLLKAIILFSVTTVLSGVIVLSMLFWSDFDRPKEVPKNLSGPEVVDYLEKSHIEKGVLSRIRIYGVNEVEDGYEVSYSRLSGSDNSTFKLTYDNKLVGIEGYSNPRFKKSRFISFDRIVIITIMVAFYNIGKRATIELKGEGANSPKSKEKAVG